MAELPLSCTCGKVVGRVTDVGGSGSSRAVCYCDDCQTYAHHLGRADDILDEHGGTAVVQVTPSQIRIDKGQEHLRCVRLSPNGTMRWYAGCCDTPLANLSASPQLPFAGLSYLTVRSAPGADELLGPVTMRLGARYGKGQVPSDAVDKPPLSMLLRLGLQLGVARLQGKHAPSPFRNADGSDLAQPTVLTKAQRMEAKAHAGC